MEESYERRYWCRVRWRFICPVPGQDPARGQADGQGDHRRPDLRGLRPQHGLRDGHWPHVRQGVGHGPSAQG